MEDIKYSDNLSTTDKLLFFILEELKELNKQPKVIDKAIEKPKPKTNTKKKG